MKKFTVFRRVEPKSRHFWRTGGFGVYPVLETRSELLAHLIAGLMPTGTLSMHIESHPKVDAEIIPIQC